MGKTPILVEDVLRTFNNSRNIYRTIYGIAKETNTKKKLVRKIVKLMIKAELLYNSHYINQYNRKLYTTNKNAIRAI